jgi:hypothetical protein
MLKSESKKDFQNEKIEMFCWIKYRAASREKGEGTSHQRI